MIPKIIHYCWFGGGLMPQSQRNCIQGWKRLMPDYTFMRWDESTFDLDKYPLAKYACQVKRYALASDVCRYNVLAEYGGIYLDTDVEVFLRYDPYLNYNFFSGIEYYEHLFRANNVQSLYLNIDGTVNNPSEDVPHLEILTSTIGCCPHLKIICDLRDFYNNAEASRDRAFHYRDWVNNDRLVARFLYQYGFRYRNETQYFGDGMVVYGTGLMGYAYCHDKGYSLSYHHNAASWESDSWTFVHKMHVLFDKLGILNYWNLLQKTHLHK